MFERLRFIRYALRFERAFKSDRWDDVRGCFHDDAIYVVEGSASEYDGEHRGAEAIVSVFKRMLDEFDRRFDRRKPGASGWWRKVDGELVIPWKARYTLGAEHVMLHGTSRCRFEGSKIRRLGDVMNADECVRWAALASRSSGPPAGA
jgi:hypothetical protein